MAIEKIKNFNDGYGNFDGSAKPTTFADMHEFMKNQNNVLMQLAAKCWQPGTSYAVGDIVSTSSMGGYFARCTKAGKSSDSEPTWKKDGSTTDGTVTWAVYRLVLTDMLESLIAPIILKRFPVGTIIESEKNVNPGTYIGGTWELMPAGYVTISAGTYTETQDGKAVAYNFKAGETYGEAAHKLTVGELAAHSHIEYLPTDNKDSNPIVDARHESDGKMGGGTIRTATYMGWTNTASKYIYTNTQGNNTYHNNMQPSKAVYRFKRTA